MKSKSKLILFFRFIVFSLYFNQTLVVAQDDLHHQAFANTLPLQAPDHIAKKSGLWMDPLTWQGGQLPTENSSVLVPQGIDITLTTKLETPLDFLLVKGGLTLGSKNNTKLILNTLWITKEASLDIGSDVEPVDDNLSAEIIFRQSVRPQDDEGLRGGLISMGKVNINGASKRSYAVSKTPLVKGTHIFSIDPDANWKVGDRLIFPAVELDQKDELRNIVNVQNNGQDITLDRPLKQDHILPSQLNTYVPIANMTRNVRFSTHKSVPTQQRAHILFMHRQTGVNINHASFQRLGRTDAKRPHTQIVRDNTGAILPESKLNTIGRYSVHFHIQQGASKDIAPHTITNSVVSDCLKHAVVNHGGHVIASNNVTYNCAGAHFFAENGSEIGKFENNLAIRSNGSMLAFDEREANSDFGHGGHGFWMQGGGVEVKNNYAFGHSSSAYFYFGQYMVENGQTIYFLRENAPILEDYNLEYPLHSSDVPISFSNNVAVSSTRGLDIWNNMEHATHDVSTKVFDSIFYSNKLTAIFIPYSKNIEIDNVSIIGGDNFPGIGINTNTKTSDLTVRNSLIVGYTIGIELPRHGNTVIDGLKVNNNTNFMVRSPLSRSRSFTFKNLDIFEANIFERIAHKLGIDLPLINSKRYPNTNDFFMQGVWPSERGDISMIFEPTQIVIDSGENPYVGKQLYYPEQAPEFVPFGNIEVDEIKGKTNRKLWSEYSLAVGGALLPDSAERHKKVRGFVGPPTEYLERIPTKYFNIEPTIYKGNYLRDYSNDDFKDGWNFVSLDVAGNNRTVMIYADKIPPTFEIDPRVRLKIHPDDVPFGLRLQGNVIDYVGGIRTVNPVNREFRNLIVNEKGYINVVYPITDAAGNINNLKYSIKVTDSEPPRGQSLVHYN